jgi:hypothetical protein
LCSVGFISFIGFIIFISFIISDYHTKFLKNPENYKQKIKGNKLKNYRLFVALKTQKPIVASVLINV